jgi:hypothetical protein
LFFLSEKNTGTQNIENLTRTKKKMFLDLATPINHKKLNDSLDNSIEFALPR